MTHVALLGFGTVGSAVARQLTSSPRFQHIRLTHIFDRGADRKRHLVLYPKIVWTSCIDDILDSNVDIVVEALGGVDPAAEWIRQALLHGKSVVTANRQVVARDGASLWTLAARQGRQFRFEAAVGGAMPIVRAIGDGLAGDRLTRIELSSMDDSVSFEAAVEDGRRNGLAEADSRADLHGNDAPRDSVFGRAKGPRNVAVISDITAIARDRAAFVPPPALTSDFSVRRQWAAGAPGVLTPVFAEAV